MGITKNRQTKENIIRMAKAAFPQRGVPRIAELTEGMCNAAYKLTFEDGFQTILKIASPIKTGFMTNECNLMEAEVKAMKLDICDGSFGRRREFQTSYGSGKITKTAVRGYRR